MLTTVTSTVIG